MHLHDGAQVVLEGSCGIVGDWLRAGAPESRDAIPFRGQAIVA